MVLIDTNILNLFLHAMMYGDFPRTTDQGVREQQIATFRLYLWAQLGVGRVVVGEAQSNTHPEKKEWLQRIINVQLPEVWVQGEDVDRWNARTIELQKHHAGTLDCQVVSEAELVDGVTTLISFDKKMVRNLRPHAKVDLKYPSEHWDSLAIPRGTQPNWKPADSNPLSKATFWRWD